MAFTEWEICRTAIGQRGVEVLLCDDDAAFLTVLEEGIVRIFAKLNRKAVISVFRSPREIPREAFAACDMAFLDIDFADDAQNGIHAARALRQCNSRALIFFVTNYVDYAPAGYEVQAFRYILKRELDEVLERYLLQAAEHMAEGLGCLRLRDREQTVELALEEISYLEVLDHYVSIHAGDGIYTLGATLSGLEKELGTHGFLRIHNSYLVNMRRIHRFRSRECVLTDGTSLAVSAKNYSQQKEKYLMWKVMK